jgi:ABC-type branched-subunit amino acid transport system substrate-binding protein
MAHRSTARSGSRKRSRLAGGVSMVLGVTLALALVGCGRSSGGATTPPVSSAPAGSASASASATPAGDFGTLKGICGAGNAKTATGRGVTATEIRIGVTADPGAAAAPGLEQEFFDTADGFAKWCNDAGGINGRKVVIDKWDAKLFDVGQAMTSACQKDFMLVGNGNAFDSAGVKVREGCKLGMIPAYVVSPEAANAKLQVQPTPNPSNQINNGALRLLANKYPDVKTKGICIGSSTLASIRPVGLRTQEYLPEVGIKVANYQEHPPLVDNYRPYMEQCKGAGSAAYYEISAQDPSPEVQAMKNTGFNPEFIVYSTQFYGPQAVAAAKATPVFPPSYVQFGALPFELADQYPVLKQAQDIVNAAVKNPKLTTFTDSAFSAWTLFADSATACGDTLTVDCVLQKAGNHDDWTAGGLYPVHSTKPGSPLSKCVILVQLTPNGFVYAKDATAPDNGPYNCNGDNVKSVKTYQ